MNRKRLLINQIYLVYLALLNKLCNQFANKSLAVNSVYVLSAIASISLGVSKAIAATYNVTNTTDTLDLNDPNYVGSLRWAIEQAENNPGADTININAGGTITVDNQDPSIATVNGTCKSDIDYIPAAAFKITDSLTINGNGAIIDGGRTGGTGSLTGRRIFYIPNNTSAVINLNNLTLQNGNAAVIENNSRRHIASGGGDGNPCSNGGVIWMEDSTLNLDKVRVSGGLSNDGGAINIQSGFLTVNDSTFDGNLARDDGGVFDIDNLASVSMLNSTMTNNSSGVNTNLTGQNGSTNGTGGIARIQGNFNLTYVTAAYNVAGGKGAFDIRGTSNFVLRNNLFIENTLAGTNTVKHCAPDDGVNIETNITVQNNNWADTNDCGTTMNVDTSEDIQLSSNLAANSGITPTLALANTSSVNGIIETTDSLCPGGVGANDQRDVERAVNAGCEPGAYELQAAVTTDYGDAPNTYGDASHDLASSNLYLGTVPPDGEVSTQLTSAASSDDDDGNDDEDAFVVLPNVPLVDPSITDLTFGRNYNLKVPLTNTTGESATLHAWIDFNQNGKFEAEEYQFARVEDSDTNASLTWNIPLTTLIGDTYARLRLTSDILTDNTGVLDPLNLIDVDDRSVGNATDGEVEDYPVSVSVPLYDYGDAPDTATGTGTGNYQTTETDEGPTHIVIKDPLDLLHLSLGNNIDGDDGSLQNLEANADDGDTKNVDLVGTILSNGDTGLDDEDGVTSFPALTAIPGQTYTVPVTVRNNIPLLNAFVVGYIDFNQDGDFDDKGEKSATVTVPSDLLTVSSNSISLDTTGEPRTINVIFTVPDDVTPGNTYARFRLGSIKEIVESATGVTVSTNNGEVNNGEVEDYQMTIAPSGCAIGGGTVDANIAPYISAEVYNDSIAKREVVDTLDDDWRTALGQDSNPDLESWFGTVAQNGVAIANFSYIDPATNNNTNVTAELVQVPITGFADCAGETNSTSIIPDIVNGDTLQAGSPRPASLYDNTDQPSYWTESGSSGSNDDKRNAIRFTFAQPVKSFGAWFGDLETRSDGDGTLPPPAGDGTVAILRLLDADGDRIGADIPIAPNNVYNGNPPTSSPVNQEACGADNTTIGCGNKSTRWIGFVDNNPVPQVRQVLVIVGDDDSVADKNDADNEHLSFIGANVVPTSNNPNLILVKRITAINPGQPDQQLFNTFNDDGIANNADNDPNWHNDDDAYLPGVSEVTGIKPGDEIEYTIYFLSNGKADAKQVEICDVIPDETTFVKNTYGVEVGIGLGLTTNEPPTTNPPAVQLSNVMGDEAETTDRKAQGAFYPPNTTPPALCDKPDPNDPSDSPNLIDVNSSNNVSGAVWVKLKDPLPPATSSSTPSNSYGFIRFRAKVR